MFKRQLLTVYVIALVLTACGFHLRGQLPLPQSVDVLYVEGERSEFKSRLQELLTQAGASVVSSASAAKVIIVLDEVSTKREVNTIDGRGKSNSYDLVSRVNYRLVDSSGRVIRSKSLKESTIYDYDPVQQLEAESEERELRKEMEQELLFRLLQQLRASGAQLINEQATEAK